MSLISNSLTSPSNLTIPSVIERQNGVERSFDIFSRLLSRRIIYIAGQVDQNSMAVATASLINLANDPGDISIYIQSPGGSVYDGLGFIDCMDLVKTGKLGGQVCDINTIVMGHAMSFGAVISAKGTPGKRFALENSRIMIHQVSSGFQGQASDIQIAANEAMLLREKLDRMLADSSDISYKEMVKLTERDTFLSAAQAKDIGLIDEVLAP